jgi:hypothetical protein
VKKFKLQVTVESKEDGDTCQSVKTTTEEIYGMVGLTATVDSIEEAQ